MRRDWIGELLGVGLRVKDISLEAGVPQSTLRGYITGKVAFGTKSKHYENIRNANRRLAARELKGLGLSSDKAREFKRTFYNPEAEVKRLPDRIRYVKHIDVVDTGEFHQLWILGVFYNPKTGKRRVEVGSSFAHVVRDYDRDLEEAIWSAKKKLGYEWELEKLLEEHYVIAREEAANPNNITEL